MEGIISDIEKANEAGNSRAVWEAVKYIGGSSKRPAPKQPSKSEELAEAWRAFCADTKFACTKAESRRPDYEDIGDASEREDDVPTMEELELCLKALKAGRACGPDQIPVEAYRGSESEKNDLFDFIKQCWREERLPTTLGMGTFITIFKNGRKDDYVYENYRLIIILNHSYKVLSSLLLLRLLKETTCYFSKSQAGFWKGRSCLDNIMILD